MYIDISYIYIYIHLNDDKRMHHGLKESYADMVKLGVTVADMSSWNQSHSCDKTWCGIGKQ